MLSKWFPRNEGTLDRVLRISLGLLVVSQVFVGLQTPWAWLGLLPIFTGALGSCPAYTLFGIGTCELKKG